LIKIGRIGRCHGLKGEVRVASRADSPDLFSGTLLLSDGRNPPVARESAGWRPHQGQILLRFKGVADRTAAEALRGLDILIEADRLPDLAEDEVYLHELVGLAVEDAETGRPLGTLSRVDILAERELWVITGPDGREILFPVVEEFVRGIDLEAGLVRIAPPPGLLELYL
jgi:16S rRNA processing protein RimM